jgi:CheY-like chemotaxis protein
MSKIILLVEDDEDNRDLVEFVILKSQLNIELVTAENGKEAIDRVQNKKPDLILMDMQMPIMDGYTAVSILKEYPEYNAIPIIALTALARPEDIIRTKSIGCVEHATKPIDPDELIRVINKYL